MHIPTCVRRSHWFLHRMARSPVYCNIHIPDVLLMILVDVHSPFRESALHTMFLYRPLSLLSCKHPLRQKQNCYQPYSLCAPDLPIPGRNRSLYMYWSDLPAFPCWLTGTLGSITGIGNGKYPKSLCRYTYIPVILAHYKDCNEQVVRQHPVRRICVGRAMNDINKNRMCDIGRDCLLLLLSCLTLGSTLLFLFWLAVRYYLCPTLSYLKLPVQNWWKKKQFLHVLVRPYVFGNQ